MSKPYHHKDLRESLLQAAVRLIAEVGLAAFTLREVARRAGVSHNAPYRHFRDREQLLAAVAEQGFQELTQSMAAASCVPTEALERLKASGLAYVEFAMRRPEHFTAMFEAPLEDGRWKDMADPGADAFALLVQLVQVCQDAGWMRQGDVHQVALVNWSMMHGIAKLAIAKRLPYATLEEVLQFTRFVCDRCLLTPGADPN